MGNNDFLNAEDMLVFAERRKIEMLEGKKASQIKAVSERIHMAAQLGEDEIECPSNLFPETEEFFLSKNYKFYESKKTFFGYDLDQRMISWRGDK